MSRYQLISEIYIANPLAYCSYEAFDAIKKMEEKIIVYEAALKKIADEDFRGNRSRASTFAYQVLNGRHNGCDPK